MRVLHVQAYFAPAWVYGGPPRSVLGLCKALQRNGVEVLKGPDSDENGTFAWILDPDRNKVELWEPMPRDENNRAK